MRRRLLLAGRVPQVGRDPSGRGHPPDVWPYLTSAEEITMGSPGALRFFEQNTDASNRFRNAARLTPQSCYHNGDFIFVE